MRTKFFILIILVYAVTVHYGCKNSTEPGASRTDLLTSTPWQVQKVLIPGSTPGQTIDVTGQFPYVTILFTKEGSYVTTTQSGTWEWTEQETKILFDKNSTTQSTATILELNANALRISMTSPVLGSSLTPFDVSFAPTPASANALPEINFETLWKEYDRRYSFFEVKKINWDSLHAVYRPQVTSQTSALGLFQIMSSMLAHLKDGHVNLITPFARYSYTDWYTKYPTNFLGLNATVRYLTADYGFTASNMMRYGKVSNDIGYLYIGPNFSGTTSAWSEAIDVVIDSLKNMKGIIVDIRHNGGGSDALSKIVVSRFTDQSRIFSYIRWRNPGQNHNDFTDYEAMSIGPAGTRQFLKPVVLLTNRRCFSSAEETVLMMKALPNVTVVGDTTGGGFGNPIVLQLPNGWTYWVPRWIMYTAQKTNYEGIGLPPDIPVTIGVADSAAGRDVILERAIQRLSGQ
ncbi:MAG: S41 family peptidase [Ignavibacteriales bacterium]|nr:S41 family peptidase [Ignavibacteriales bacterium]